MLACGLVVLDKCPGVRPKGTYEVSDLYVGGNVLLSEEATIQGDLLAMSLYCLATLPLISLLDDAENVMQA